MKSKKINTEFAIPKFLSVKEASEFFRWPIGGLRFKIFNRDTDPKFAKCLRRVGRKILIEREALEKYIDSSTKL